MESAISFLKVKAPGLSGETSFSVPAGVSAALITASQSESDQVIRLVLGLHRPVAGSVTVFGEEVADAGERRLTELRSEVAVVYPTGGLISNLKVWENLVLPLRYHRGLKDAELEEPVTAALERVGYRGDLMELPGHLSNFQQRQIGMARALLLKPRLILYNALFAGLSAREKETVAAAANRFQRERPETTSLFLAPTLDAVREAGAQHCIVLEERLDD